MPDNPTPPIDTAPSGGQVGGRGGERAATSNGRPTGGSKPIEPIEPIEPTRAGADDGGGGELSIAVSDSRKQRRTKTRQRAAIEWVVAVSVAVLAAFLIKTWLVQAFVIPSGSMRPTLEVDDRVLVSKISYRMGELERGDVIVFDNPARLPQEPAQLIKRVVAVEGDEVATVDGRLVVNDQPVNEPYLQPGTVTRGPDGNDMAPRTVPDDHIFVMGDNRSDSRDSRFLGAVSEDDVVGKAFFRLWPPGRLGRL